MPHLWVRAEQRDNEKRTALTPDGARSLLDKGMRVSIEASPSRIISTADYAAKGCTIVPQNSWPDAPKDALILGLKELPDDASPLIHRHIMFGHAFKGQYSGIKLLKRFKAGGGTLFDLEYLLNEHGKRVAAFGYWAGFVGAAVTLMCWISQKKQEPCPPVTPFKDKDHLVDTLKKELTTVAHANAPTALVIGAFGRVGTGVVDLCGELNVTVTQWDINETSQGGPFPEILDRDLFFNCILATQGCPIFVGPEMLSLPRKLRVIGDIACDPDSDYNPLPIYHAPTTWGRPALRVAHSPPLHVMAIDNLPSLLPLESSLDFASQLLPWLEKIDKLDTSVWRSSRELFQTKLAEV